MANGFGLSYQPGQPQADAQVNGRPRGANSRVQEAVKFLSLRTPKTYGSMGRPIAPAPLLTAPGGMGQPGARSGATAQAIAQLAGIPMAPPAAPMLPPALPGSGSGGVQGGGGWDQWARQERGLAGGPRFGVERPVSGTDTPWSGPAPIPPPVIRPGLETGEGPGAAIPALPPPFQGPQQPLPGPSAQSLLDELLRQQPSGMPDYQDFGGY